MLKSIEASREWLKSKSYYSLDLYSYEVPDGLSLLMSRKVNVVGRRTKAHWSWKVGLDQRGGNKQTVSCQKILARPWMMFQRRTGNGRECGCWVPTLPVRSKGQLRYDLTIWPLFLFHHEEEVRALVELAHFKPLRNSTAVSLQQPNPAA